MDKCKIRLSTFTSNVIEKDALCFNFIKTDGMPNRNGFLNTLIPNLLRVKKKRREKIRAALSGMGKPNADEITQAIDQVNDKVYFGNAEMERLEVEIWLLPTKQSATAFAEIEECELAIANLTLTEYLRGMLNEYALLPQYKREEFLFADTIHLLYDAMDTEQLVRFECKGDTCKVFPFQHMHEYLFEQTNYLIAYDIERHQIRAFPIPELERPYLLKSTFVPSEDLIEKLQAFWEDLLGNTDRIVELGEDYEDRQRQKRRG